MNKNNQKIKAIETVKDLIFDEQNANLGTERGRAMLEHSFESHGAGRSVLADKNGKLIAGNKSAEVFAEQGGKDVIVVQSDGKKLVIVQRTDLDLDKDTKARELAVLDNRTSEIDLRWNAGVLQSLVSAEVNLNAAFSRDELAALAQMQETEQKAALNRLTVTAPSEFPLFDENLPTNHICPKCGYEWS